jgi:hypothetical protein
MTRRVGLLVVLALAGCGGSAAHSTSVQRSATPPSKAYTASLAYANCLRAHGLDHPDPDANGDFSLTPKQEERLKESAPLQQRRQADKDCFHFLKGTVSTKPLSKAAKRAALAPLRDLKQCLVGLGYEVGNPVVKNLKRGRAMFGFDSAGSRPVTKAARAKQHAAQITCEKRVRLAQRLDEIIKLDRGEAR